MKMLALIAMALLCGCSSNVYEHKRGEDYVKFSRTVFGLNQTIGELSVGTDQNGVKNLKLTSYDTKDSQIVGAAVEAAVKAAVKP